MAKRYQTVLFDFGGTLDSDGVAWKERVHRHYRDEGVAMSAEEFAPLFYAADDPLIGTIGRESDLGTTAAALMENLEAEFGRRSGSADGVRAKRAAAHFMAEASAAFARNRPMLEKLAGRYRLGIVSNFYGNLEAVCAGAGLSPYFGAMADSHCVGVEKPEPAIFKAALDPLQGRPETALFVGDSLRRDREGARRMGMDFIWIAPVETQQAEAASLSHPVVARLTDLAEILL